MTFIKSSAVLMTASAMLLISAPALADDTQTSEAKTKTSTESWRLSTGVNYSTGSYGEVTDTKVISAPVALKYRNGDFSIRVSVPYVRVDGLGSLIETPEGSGGGSGRGRGRGGDNSGSGSGSGNSGSGGSGSGGGEVIDDNGTNVRSKRSGLGDVVIAATYSFDLGSNFYIDATSKVKLPTASTAKRLGTGEIDITPALDLVKEVGPATFYVHGRRKFAGKPTGSLIRSTWGAGAGASVRANDTLTLGADYDWQQSSLTGNSATSDVSGWASVRLNSKINLSAFASTGLNSNSADFAGVFASGSAAQRCSKTPITFCGFSFAASFSRTACETSRPSVPSRRAQSIRPR